MEPGVRKGRQPISAPYAASASGTGWKKVVPPAEQSPLPPEVRPMAVSPREERAAAVARHTGSGRRTPRR
ncbi:hypothetical protein GCM10020227_16700 [Streptomyces flavovirens]